jgi:hypothetical protein
VTIAGFRLGNSRKFDPGDPVPPTPDASTGPAIVSCSRALNEFAPPAFAPARICPVDVRFTSQPPRSTVPPKPQPCASLQPAPRESSTLRARRVPRPKKPASIEMSPPKPPSVKARVVT